MYDCKDGPGGESTIYLQTSEKVSIIPPCFYSLLLIYGEKVEDCPHSKHFGHSVNLLISYYVQSIELSYSGYIKI